MLPAFFQMDSDFNSLPRKNIGPILQFQIEGESALFETAGAAWAVLLTLCPALHRMIHWGGDLPTHKKGHLGRRRGDPMNRRGFWILLALSAVLSVATVVQAATKTWVGKCRKCGDVQIKQKDSMPDNGCKNRNVPSGFCNGSIEWKEQK